MTGKFMSFKILVLIGWLSVALCFADGSTAWAMIPRPTPPGDLCLNCHESATPTPGAPANWTLLPQYQGEAGCITCHSSSASSTTYILNPGGSPEVTVPVTVYTGSTEPTEFLASGNFWWVKGPADLISGSPNNWTGGGNDQGGHNIFPGEIDERYTLEGVSVAPGHSSGCLNPDSCHSNLNTEDTTYGPRQSCLKCHMMMKGTDYPAGFHHANDSALLVGMGHYVPGDPGFDGYYRYLTGHMSGEGHGVAGIEDEDWEATVSSTDHNEYLGAQHALNSPGGFALADDRHTSTAFCSGCHGNFHVASEYPAGKADPEDPESPYEWLRHPVGMVLPDDEGSDFHYYKKYNPNVPLGRPDLTSFTGASDIVTPGTDIINCLSCHRSHGTPGGSHLRWDPTQWDACATCHLTKRSSIEGQYICDAIDDCNDCHTSHGRSLRFQYEDLPDYPGVFRAEDEFGGDHDNKDLIWMKMDFYGPVEHTTDEVLFPIPEDNSPYVLGVEPYNGICEVCHTDTLYWKNDGTGAPHYGGPGVEEQCNVCHLHVNEWLGDMPDDAGHHVHNGEFARGPDEMDCSVCHGKGGTVTEMADAGACDSCHSPGGVFNGVNDPVVGAKANWADGVYDAEGNLKDGKAKWCASCHDWSATGGNLIDDFESYTDDSSLQSVWKGIRDARKATLEPYFETTEVVYTSINGISGQFLGAKIVWSKSGKTNALISRTFNPPIDLTGRDYFGFYLKIKGNKIKSVKVKLKKSGGGSCTASIKIKDSGLETKVWRKVLLHRNDFDDNTWGLVSQIKFIFVEKNPTASVGTFVYLDEIGCDLTGPNVVGDDTTWGHYVTGHKMPCEHCHDSSSQHIDYNWRVIFDRVQDPTADNPTKHRFYRDANVTRFYPDATELDLQLPYTQYIGGQEGSFALCYWCHDESAITTSAKSQQAAENLITTFRDEDPLSLTDEHNMHYKHVVGSPPGVSHATCILCHDPHGQTKPARTRTQMEGFIYFDPNGCEIPDILTDSNTNDVPDWHDPDVNMGGARTRWGPRDGRNELCAQDQCHSIDMFDYQQVKHVAPPDPDCADGQHNNYENWSIYGSGYYKRDYSSAVLPDIGECGEACHAGGPG